MYPYCPKTRNQIRWKSEIWINPYLFQSGSTLAALSYPWIHRTDSLEHNEAKTDCLFHKSSGLIPSCLNCADQKLQHAGEKKRFPPSRTGQRLSKVRRGSARCVLLSPRPNLCGYEQKLQWPYSRFSTNVTARQPAARLPGPVEVNRNWQESAHLRPINNLSFSDVDVISIMPRAPRGAPLLFLPARINLTQHLRTYF